MDQADPWINPYLQYLSSERRLSPNTVLAVSRDLKLLPANAADITADSLKQVLIQRHAKQASPASLARLASSWRGYFAYLCQEGHLQVNPTLRLKVPKIPKALPKALKPEQVTGLLLGPPPVDFRWARAHALIELLYATGLRISEILNLKLLSNPDSASEGSWISLQRKEIQVLGKGSKTRMIPLMASTAESLIHWIDIRNKRLLASGVQSGVAYLFISPKGTACSVRQAQKDVAEYSVLKGLDRHLHPHMLRHSFGSHVLQESQDLRAVQDLLGHSSIKSTQVYTSLDFKHLSAVYDQAFPRAKK
ncbi:MAG: tyrosine recombinase XerC [Limnobacter sp.]|nr:tyrosine recombinase XerC [Limnobacter sp.]